MYPLDTVRWVDQQHTTFFSLHLFSSFLICISNFRFLPPGHRALSRPTTYTTTGWRRLIGCLKYQVFLRKRATNSRALLLKMTYQDKASHDSTPLCTLRPLRSGCDLLWNLLVRHFSQWTLCAEWIFLVSTTGRSRCIVVTSAKKRCAAKKKVEGKQNGNLCA